VDAVDLMNVTQVVVGHNDNEVGHGWFLYKISVQVANSDSAGSYWMFPLDRYATTDVNYLCVEQIVWNIQCSNTFICPLCVSYGKLSVTSSI